MADRLALAVVIVATSALAFPAVAEASLGALVQKAGTSGCVSDLGALGECVDGVGLGDARSVAVSPDGKSAYVASPDSDAVAVFDRAADGTLTQKAGTAGCISDTGSGGACVDGVALDFPVFVAVSPDGTSVYVASTGSDAVAVFDRAADGTLSQKAGTAACIQDEGLFGCADGKALELTSSVVVSPDGTSVYVTSVFDHLLGDDGAVAVFDRAADGALTQKSGVAGCISFRATTTGAPCTDAGSSIDGASSVAVSPDGISVYVGARVAGAVVVFDRAANGALTQKAGTAGCISSFGGLGCAAATALRGLSAVTVSPDGKSVYTASVENDAVGVLDRAADGTLTQKPSPAGCISESGLGSQGGAPCADGKILDAASSVVVSPDGKSVYVAALGWDAVSGFDRAPADTTPPSCVYTIVSGPPKRIDFTVSDAGGGISSIQITTAANIVLPISIPAFSVGTTSPVMFSAVKDNQTMSSRVAVVITDVDGNKASCI